MPHVLFVSYEISPVTPGGVGTFIAGITAVLLRDGYRVSLLLDIAAEEFATWQAQQVSGRSRLKSFRVADMCAGLARRREEFPSEAHWKSFQFAHCLRAVHAAMPVDFAEFVDYCGPAYYALIARLAGPAAFPARIAVRLHNTIELIDRRVGNAFQSYRTHDYALERAAIGLADMVLTPGPRYWHEEAASLYPVAAARVQPSFPVRAVLPVCADPRRARDIVSIGRISTFKGMDRMLHAAVAAVADTTLARLFRRIVVIGPGETVASSLSERDLLAIAAGVPPERLLFAGRLDEAAILAHLAEAAVAVFPNRMESFCYAAHEAHMAGVPLILSDTPAFRDHFTDGETALFFDNTVPDLLDKLRQCLEDAALRERLSRSVRQTAYRYQRHDYQQHLEGPRFAAPPGAVAADVSIIVVPPADDPARAAAAGAVLAGALPGATIRLLATSDRTASLHAFGRAWAVTTLAGVPVLPQAERLRPATLFLAADAALDPAFITRAAAMLACEPRLGAVVPGGLTPAGGSWVADIPTALEHAARAGTAVLSAVLATPGNASLVDLCADGSALTEIAALLRLRAAGRILVDDPAPSLLRQSTAIAGSRAALPGLLRRNAWWLDRTAIADATTDMLALADAIIIGTPQVGEPAELQSDLVASRHTDTVHLHALPEPGFSGGPAAHASGQVTVLAVRRAAGCPPVAWTEVDWSGEWETQAAWDRPSGMRVARAGVLRCQGARDPQISLLRGPGQGVAVLLWHGRALRVRLTSAEFSGVTLRLADLFALWPEASKGYPLVLGDSAVLDAGAVAALVAALRRGQGELGEAVFVLDPADVPLAAAIGPLVQACVVPADLRQPASRLTAAFTLALARAGVAGLALFGGAELLPLIEGLLEGGVSGMMVEVYVRPGIAWRSGGWEGLRGIAAAAVRFADRLRLHAPPGAVREGLALLGATARSFAVHLPQVRARATTPRDGPVALVFAPAPAEVPAIGHLAAAALNVIRQGVAIDAVHIAEWEVQGQLLLEAYGLAPLLRRYSGTAEILAALAGTRFIYLAPFPDGAVSAAVLAAFAAGGLAITAVGCLEHADAQVRQALSVTLWEDAAVLAAQIAAAVVCYDELSRRLDALAGAVRAETATADV